MRLHPFAVLLPILLLPRLASPQGEPLGPEFRVNTSVAFFQGSPSVAAVSEDFVVVWHGARGGLPDGQPLPDVFGQRFFSSGDPLGTEFRVNTGTYGWQEGPAVAGNASGAFVVVWQSTPPSCGPPCPPPSGSTVHGQRFTASGAPLGPEFVVSSGSPYQRDAAVAMAPSGAFLVVWNTQFASAPPGPSDVFGRFYDSSGVPQGGQFLINTAATAGYQVVGSVAADSAGNFVVVWNSQFQYTSIWNVYGQRYAASGAPLGPEFRVNSSAAPPPTSPGIGPASAVATDPAGNFVVAWASQSSSLGLFGQRFASSGPPIGPEFRVTTGVQATPAIAFDDGGNFVVVWDQDPYGAGEVFAQRYSSLGEPSGPQFRVNTTVFGPQRLPSVASTSGGTFLVTWESGPPGPTVEFDVFGQRFGGIFPVKLQDFRVE